jgi:Zn-dependent protease with chaperone function
MRSLLVACGVLLVTIALSWLLSPQTPAPALPQALLGSDAGWLARAEELSYYRRMLAVLNLILPALGLWVAIRLGWSAALRAWLETHGLGHPWLLVAAFTTVFIVVTTLLNLPLGYISLALRRMYGLSQETTIAWLARLAKELLVSLVMTLIAVEGLYWLLRAAPDRWWLWASAGFVALTLLLTYLTPYVITPLFFTQRPLADQPLRDQIFQLGQRANVPISEIYVIDASSQGNEGNAYFTGVGGSTRVVLYDTLLRSYPPEQLMTILAHELGHWREQHIWKGLLLSWIAAPVGLWIVHALLSWLLPAWGIRDRADIAGLPVILLIVTLGTLMTLPAQNWISRRWERAADQFAIQTTGDPAAFQATFVGLAKQNLSDPTPPPFLESLFSTHPAIGRRVAEAQRMLYP